MVGWRLRTVGELSVNLDARRVPVREADRVSGPYPYYGASGIVDYVNNFIFDGFYVLVAEDGENLRTRNTPVAFPATGKFWVNNHAHILQGAEGVDTRWLLYALTAVDVAPYLTGSTQPKLSQQNLNRIELLCPPLAEQRAIAAVLGALDDKIEANRRMNATLEALGRALFKSWFVDFDRSIERVTAETLRALGVLEIGDGYRAKNDEMGEPGLPFIRAGNLQGDIDTHDAEILSAESVSKAGNKLSKAGDVAFTSKGTVGRFSFVTERTPQFVYSPQLCFWRSLDWKALSPSVLYTWMLTEEFQRQVDAVATQTDMAPYVSLQDQRRMLVPKFPVEQHSLAAKLDALIARRSLSMSQSRTLVQLRDLLLPKLLSGALRVRDAERMIGDAA